MRRLIFLLALFFVFFHCEIIEARSFTTLWGGAGVSFNDNYNTAISYGLTYYKKINYKVGFGFSAFNQQFSLIRDKQINDITGGTVTMNAQYYFFSPMLVVQLGRSGHYHGYVTAGVGLYGSGTNFIHTWSHVPWPATTAFDSSGYETDDFSQLIFRGGIGFIQYASIGGNFHLTFTEDIGFLPFSMQSKKNADDDYIYFKGNMNLFFSPVYASIRLGISYVTHSKNCNLGCMIE